MIKMPAERLLGYGLLYIPLTILLILFMVPVYGAIVTAFKSQAEVPPAVIGPRQQVWQRKTSTA